MISEDELIVYAKSYLKQKGFKKKNKRWTKDIGEFTLVFYVQGSIYSKENYYIRPGIYMNKLDTSLEYYGHFVTEIQCNKLEDIFIDFEKFCEEWTDKKLIKERALAFIEWDKRNPLEKRRSNLVDYENDPCPTEIFFRVSSIVMEYILSYF